MTPRQFAIISGALDEALEYFKQREDCDDGIPNAEMNLATSIEQAQSALEAIRKEEDQPITFGR